MNIAQPPGRGLLYPACVVAALCIAVLIGLLGVDFGHHWDECAVLRYEINRWLPIEYGYPSMTYNISHLAIACHLVVKAVGFRMEDASSWRERLHRYVSDTRNQDRMKLVARSTCLITSQLAIIAVFLIVAGAWGRGEACLACLLLSFSNEFLYHSRWVVPDTLHALWSALTMAVILHALRRGSFRALYGAAALAGATVATKYTGVFIVCPLLACGLMLSRDGIPRALRRCALLLAVAGGAFLLLCPGVILEQQKFWRTLMPVYYTYTQGHGGYNVAPGLPNLGLSLLYLSTQCFSSIMVVNVAFFALAVWGAANWLAHRRREALLMLVFLVFFVGFLSSHVIMIARNLMPVIPFLAIFAARGISSCRALLPPAWRALFSCLVAAAITATLVIEAHDAVGIRRFARDYDYPVRSAREYLIEDRAHRYYVHPNIRARLLEQGGFPANVVDDPAGADFVLAFAPYLPNDIENSPFVIKEWFGTREINLRYYSIWQQKVWGMERDKPNPIILSPEDARRYGLL